MPSIVERVLATRPALLACGAELELIVVDDGSRDRTAEISPATRRCAWCGTAPTTATAPRSRPALPRRGGMVGLSGCRRHLSARSVPGAAAGGPGAGSRPGHRLADGRAASQMPLSRRVGNLFFAALVSLVGNQHITDSASGMRLIRREVLARLYPLPDGLNFTPVMTTRAIHEGLKMVEVPIAYAERVGRSKLSVVRDGTRFLQSIVWTALDYNPVRVLGAVGVACAGAGAADWPGAAGRPAAGHHRRWARGARWRSLPRRCWPWPG